METFPNWFINLHNLHSYHVLYNVLFNLILLVYIDLFIWGSKKTQLSTYLSTTLTENYAKVLRQQLITQK